MQSALELPLQVKHVISHYLQEAFPEDVPLSVL